MFVPRLVLGPQITGSIPDNPGLRVRINDDARKAVIFFGVPHPEKDVEYGGTGFMLADFQDGVLIPYLVTARHVAKALENYSDTGFFIRVNTKDGKSKVLPSSELDWSYHPDLTVDLAIAALSLSGKIYDIIYYPLRDNWFVTEDRIAKYDGPDDVLCGDPVATVGLFRLRPGYNRNMPIVHNGHIASLPDPIEPVPIRDRTTGKVIHSEVYLIEAQTLDGLSGSPVFTNEALCLAFSSPHHGAYPSAYGALVLLGIYIGCWDGEPGEILAKDRNLKGGTRVPVGVGMVVPAQKIIELIRGDPKLLEYRNNRVNLVKNANAAVQDSALGSDNPTHREDFTALLNAAVRKPEPKD
jgi:hypothetical protein